MSFCWTVAQSKCTKQRLLLTTSKQGPSKNLRSTCLDNSWLMSIRVKTGEAPSGIVCSRPIWSRSSRGSISALANRCSSLGRFITKGSIHSMKTNNSNQAQTYLPTTLTNRKKTILSLTATPPLAASSAVYAWKRRQGRIRSLTFARAQGRTLFTLSASSSGFIKHARSKTWTTM